MTGKVQFLEGPKQGFFKKYGFIIISDMTSQSHILQMTAFLPYFWILSQIGFASIWNLMSSFGKVSQPFCTEFVWASLRFFSNCEISGAQTSDFSDFRASYCQQIVFEKVTVLRLCTFCHQMKNVGQTIFGAGPLFLRMVLAVNLAVVVYSKHA